MKHCVDDVFTQKNTTETRFIALLGTSMFEGISKPSSTTQIRNLSLSDVVGIVHLRPTTWIHTQHLHYHQHDSL